MDFNKGDLPPEGRDIRAAERDANIPNSMLPAVSISVSTLVETAVVIRRSAASQRSEMPPFGSAAKASWST